MKHDSIDCLKALLPNFVSEWIGPTAIVTAAASAGVAVSPIGLAAAGICFYLACSVRGSRAASEKEELNRQAIATLRDYLKDGERDHAKLKLQLNTIGFDLLISQNELSQRLASLEALAKTPVATEQQIKDFFAAHDGLLASLSYFMEENFTEVMAALERQDLKLDEIKAGNAELLAEVRAIGKKLDHIVELLQKQLAEKDAQLSRKDQQLAESAKREAEMLKLVAARLTAASDAGDVQAQQAIANVEAGKPAQGSVEFYDIQLRNKEAESLQLHRERALAARTARDITAAITSYTYITLHAPTDVDAWNELGYLQYLRGQLSDSESSYRTVLSLAGENRAWEAAAYGNLGTIFKTRGDFDDAEAMHRKALVINEEIGSIQGMASDYSNLGAVMFTRRNLEGAQEMHSKALPLHEQLGNQAGMAHNYGNLGIVSLKFGDLDRAESLIRKSLSIYESIGSNSGIHTQYCNLANVMGSRGDFDGARLLHQKALAICEQHGMREGMAYAYQNLGLVEDCRGNPAAARLHWFLAFELFNNLGAKHMVEQIRGWLDKLPPE